MKTLQADTHSLCHKKYDVHYITFTASLERLKREALKAFQCTSTVKAIMKNTGILAKTLATILVFVRRWTFAVLTH